MGIPELAEQVEAGDFTEGHRGEGLKVAGFKRVPEHPNSNIQVPEKLQNPRSGCQGHSGRE